MKPHPTLQPWSFEPIGIARTVFKEKFGIPRQPGLVGGATGVIKFRDDEELRLALRELEGFSHLWVIFVFHEHGAQKWKPGIRPPRLGGARKVGVLASRSPHRPNPIGLSVVKLERVERDAPGGAEIHVSGVDLLDGTPVLDLKPYLPYADIVPDATSGWAGEEIQRTPVAWTEKAREDLAEVTAQSAQDPRYDAFESLITQVLEIDPRPAFQKRRMPPGSPEAEGRRFGIAVLDHDVKWEIREGRFLVTAIEPLGKSIPAKSPRNGTSAPQSD